MRIRRSTTTSPVFTPVSPCSSSSSSSCFSSSTHSTISTHSLSSSSNSTSSSLSLSPTRRCEGLDLLVKAVYHVDGSVIGVPYIQRRVIRRRKPALKFTNLVINSAMEERENGDEIEDDDEDEEGEVFDSGDLDKKIKKQGKRSNALPSKYQDSVLQSWKPKDRRRRRRSSKGEIPRSL